MTVSDYRINILTHQTIRQILETPKKIVHQTGKINVI